MPTVIEKAIEQSIVKASKSNKPMVIPRPTPLFWALLATLAVADLIGIRLVQIRFDEIHAEAKTQHMVTY